MRTTTELEGHDDGDRYAPADATMGAFIRTVALGRVRLLAMDVDGVLTDGVIGYDDAGREHKRFHVADGLGLVVLRQVGIRLAWISGRNHVGVARRAGELGVEELHQGVRDKRAALAEICVRLGINLTEVAYIGDDWNDIPAFEAVGCAIAVANASPDVKEFAAMVTAQAGGVGAVREVCEAILDARGERALALARYLESLRGFNPEGDNAGETEVM